MLMPFQETLGIPVVAYGESRDFPAFFSRTSGFTVRICCLNQA